MKRVAVLVIALCSASLSANASPTITIGETEVKLPAPAGFEAIGQRGYSWSRMQREVITPSNRLLVAYAASEVLTNPETSTPPKLKRLFHAQSPRGVEAVVCSRQQFAEMAMALDNTLVYAEDQERAGDERDLELGEIDSLGIYDSSPNHVSFAMRKSIIIDDVEAPRSLFTVCSMTNVGGKVLNLYCTVDDESDQDRDWAKAQLTAWRKQVLASNPGPPEEAAPVSKAKLGAAAGLFAALLTLGVYGMVWIRNRNAAAKDRSPR